MLGQTIANRYKLNEELISDSLCTLYKAQDLHENKPVLVSLLSEKSLSRPLEVQLRFKRSAEQVSKLNYPNLLKTLLVGEFDNQTYLIYEHFDSQGLSSYLNQPQNLNQPWDIDKAVDLILQISSALSVAHEQNILHQAIQPANILISQAQPQSAKLFNFGCSILKDISKITEKEDIISTFGYLSPESSGILRKPIDARSDIYSLGILFYQLLTGRLPYEAQDISTLIHQHIATKPVPPSKLNGQIPPVLDNIILRLIAKEPQERYQSLKGLVHDLKECQNQRKEGKILIDFEIARQDRLAQISFSTKLIGRDKELNRLNDLLVKTKQGQGSLVFVYGEPGIGKSRLVDELRGSIHSLNGLFCGGKCYQFEFRTPYKVFSEAIDAYIEKLKRLSQDEQQLHIKRIKEALGELGGEVEKIAPTITELIGAPPKLVELEPEKEKIRFLITVTNFLAAMSTDDSPLLMFLDDLQWADDGSLEILERFAEKLKSTSNLLIVSYRDNEVGPNHPLSQLIARIANYGPHITNIPVKAFSFAETSQMISQIIMEKEASVLPLAQELQERAKGNPFFTLELLHSLVDSKIIYLKDDHYTYDLEKLKTASLPTTIVDAVLKRMTDLSAEATQILSYASVMGKELDFKLLTELVNKPADAIFSSIENGIQNQLLFRDLTGRENIFFMHDRIREAFYKRVAEEERVPLHRHIAEVLEEQNKDNPDAVLYELAYHFTQGRVEDSALKYSIAAGHKAKESYANTLAAELYYYAEGVLERRNETHTPRYIDLMESLGEAYRLTGRFDDALKSFQICEGLIGKEEVFHHVRIMSRIADTVFGSGKAQESAAISEKALKLLGFWVPKTRIGVFIGIGKQLIIQMLHSAFPKVFIKESFVGSEKQLVGTRIMYRLAHTLYFSDAYRCFYIVLSFLNTAELCGPCKELALSYSGMPAAWAVLPFRLRAKVDFQKGINLSRKIGDVVHEGVGYAYYGIDCYLGSRAREGLECTQKSINLLKQKGEYFELGTAYVFRNFNSHIFGRLQENREEVEETLSAMRSVNCLQPLGWGLYEKVFLYTLLGDFYEGIKEDIMLSRSYETRIGDRSNTLLAMGRTIFLYTRMKNYSEALQLADEVRKLFPVYYNKGPWAVESLIEGAQAHLDCIVDNPDLSFSTKKEYLSKSSWLIFHARPYSLSFVFPFIRGWTYQVWGTYNWLQGRKKRAVKLWDKALVWLRTNKNNPGGDKYRIAYILLEEAKFLLQDNPQDKKALGNLLEAKELFSGMGCKLDLETCNTLLTKIMPSGEGLEGREALTQRRHLESLLSTTRAIGSVFVLDELLNKIMDYALKVTGAERGFLLLYDDKTNQLSLKLSHGVNALESFSFEAYKLSLELIRESEKVKDTIIASSDSASTPKIQSELKSYNVKQALAAYLTSRDKPIGILYLDNQLSSGTFGKQELELMQSFAVQASVSLENAHLVSDLLDQARLRQELELGREIQMDLLPKVTPTIPGLKLTGLMLPAKEIGGDYYDFLPNPTTHNLSVVIGDVSGKGVAAGLLMAMVKTCLYALNKQPITPKQILLSTNEMLYEHINAKKFMTMLYLTWDPVQKKLFYSSAGHEHILIYRNKLGSDGVVPQGTSPNVEAIISGGFMLGMIPDIDQYLEDRELNLNPGDKVILYTDGVTEARNPSEDLFGLSRLTDIISKHGSKPAQDLLSIIKEEVYSYIDTREQYDDITLVVMEAT